MINYCLTLEKFKKRYYFEIDGGIYVNFGPKWGHLCNFPNGRRASGRTEKRRFKGVSQVSRLMIATSAVPIDSLQAIQSAAHDSSDEELDPLPDETVLKTGWLSKKGRHGV